jgi:Bacterial membrane protein YfhO
VDRWKNPRWRAGIVVAVAVVFSAVTLWPETRGAHRFNDLPAHVAWVRWAADRIASGHSPLDGWLPQLALGAPHFHQYQVLPHIVAGLLATLSDPETVVRWSLYLLVATWPISVYIGARLLDQRRRVAALAALLAPLLASAPGFGLEWSSYLYRGSGLWTQAFAMWLIPLSMGLTWRAVNRGRGFALAALVLAATLCCHLFWGYVAVIWLGVVVLAGAGSFVRRIGRGALVATGGVLASAWLLVPLVTDLRFVGLTQFNPKEFTSYGARQALEWLVDGRLLDNDRELLPLLTILAVIGAGVAVSRFRRDPVTRVILVFTVTSFVLYFGRPTLGPVVDWVPWLNELPLHRFVGPFQLGALLLAGIGGSAIIGFVFDLVRRLGSLRPGYSIAAFAVIGVAVLLPAVVERVRFADASARLVNVQRVMQRDDGADFANLVALATRRGGGRIFAGDVTSGSNFTVGLIPAYEEILNDGGLGIGFAGRVASISVVTELGFDPGRLDHYALYGVRYVIVPSVAEPRVPAKLLRTRGVYSLFEVGDGGYLRVVDSIGPAITANRENLGGQTNSYISSNLPAQGVTRPIAFDGDPAARPTISVADLPSEAAGSVRHEADHPDDGQFSGRVTMHRRALVVLAESYHGRWTATVDGKPVKTQMVAPSFVAAVVPAGTHQIAFRYAPYPASNYALLFSVGILAIGSLSLIDRRVRRRAQT